jgi:ABC-type lipoprotein release transport system permease subunit
MRSLRVALLGTVAGLSAAFLTVRGLSAMLYSVAPTDPVVYVSVSAFLLCTTLLASLVPAWRAARMDPVRTLRAD